jgi:perosamine synthetase
LTNDADLGQLAKHLSTTAKLPHRWEYYHDQIGYNYRLPNINAALGCAQLEQLPDLLAKKRALARRYEEAFRGVEGVTFFTEPEFARSNYWMNVLLLDANQAGKLQEVLEFTNDHGIMTRPAWTLMHRLPSFHDCPRMDLSVAEDLAGRLINIPSSSQL